MLGRESDSDTNTDTCRHGKFFERGGLFDTKIVVLKFVDICLRPLGFKPPMRPVDAYGQRDGRCKKPSPHLIKQEEIE